MDFYATLLCLLCLTVGQSSEQTASTTANTNTLTPALDGNSLTSQPSRSFNPQAVTETTSVLGAQTSGLEHVQLNPPSMTSSDYSSSSVTSSQDGERTNIPERGSDDAMVTSASSSVPVSQTNTPERDNIDETSSHVDIVVAETLTTSERMLEVSASGRTSVVTTSVHVEVTSSFTFEPPSLGVVKPSTSHVYVPDPVMTSVTPLVTDVSVSSSSIASSPIIPTSSSSQHDHIPGPASASPTPEPYAGFVRTSELSSVTSSSVVISSPPQTSIQGAPFQTKVQGAPTQTSSQQTLVQQQSTSSSADHDSSVEIVDLSSGWGRFLDQRTESQLDASSHSALPSIVPVLAPTSSLAAESSSISRSSLGLTHSGVLIPVSSSAFSSATLDVSSVISPMSTDSLESSTPLIVVQTSSMVERTSSIDIPSIAISTSSPPEYSESVPATSTNVPVSASESSYSGILHVSTSSRETTQESVVSGETTQVSREATHVPVMPISTSAPPVAQRSTSVFVMPSRTETSSTSTSIYPGPISTTQPPSTTERPVTSPQVLRDCFFKLTFSVDCAVILNNSLILAEFVGSLKNVLVVNLQVPPKKIKLYDPLCGSLIIHVAFTQVPYYEVKHLLYGQFQQQQFEVPIMVDNQLIELKGVKVVEIDPPSTLSPIEVPETGLDKIDLIVIIVACCICGILITIGVILCAKECYRRKYAQSFDLLEVPHVNLKLEDFTLTRIPRPKAVYGDESVTMQAFMDNSSHRIIKSGHPDNHGNGIHSNDVQVRMKQNKDGLVVGVTGYTSQKSGGDRSLKRNSSEGFDPGDPATENLLQKDQSSTQVGANNPIFVDDDSLSTSAEHQTKKE